MTVRIPPGHSVKQCQVCGRMYRVGQYRIHCDTYYHNSHLQKNGGAK